MAHRVTLTPSGQTFVVADGQTLLEGARGAGIPMAWGCGVGACRTCAVRVTAGRISMPPGTALDDELLRAHLILPCVAVPRSDVALELAPRGGWVAPLPWTD